MNFNYHNPYPTTRIPVFARNVVSTSHPLAAQAGLRILWKGGNAVDAAIAAAAAMTICEPVSNGLGSDAFAILWDGKELHGLNASGRAPAAWTPEYFRKKYGDNAATPPKRGIDSVTVPGAVAGWVALSKKFGKLPFADLLEPAIDIAERGYLLPVVVQQKWEAARPELGSLPGFAQAFLPKGRSPRVGELWQFRAAAKALRLIAQTQGEADYRGEIAQAIERFSKENGGVHTAQDFAAYQPEWVKPIEKNYRGYTLHEIPPNGQGIAALMALGILGNFDMASHKRDGADSQHLQIEAMKLAFADVYKHCAELSHMEVTPEQMLDDAYLASRARLIDMKKAQDFGAGCVEPTFGISLQNRGHGFSLKPGPNQVAPGKRPFHTIIPAFLTKDGQPVMSFGVMGGNMQPQGHLQTLVRMLDYDQSPQAACDAPRWRFNAGLELNVEHQMDPQVVDSLRALGHRMEVINDSYQDFGAGQFIWRAGDPKVEGYVAASDSRRDG